MPLTIHEQSKLILLFEQGCIITKDGQQIAVYALETYPPIWKFTVLEESCHGELNTLEKDQIKIYKEIPDWMSF